jgi:hypothetical protein
MNRFLVLVAFLFLGTVLHGQDRIICKDGRIVYCHIINVDSSTVYFVQKIEGYDINRTIDRNEVKDMAYKKKPAITLAPVTHETNNIVPDTTENRSTLEGIARKLKLSNFYIIGGAAISSFKGDYEELSGYRYGDYYKSIRISFDIGAGFNRTITRCWSFQYGLEYVSKGMLYARSYSYYVGNKVWESYTFIVDYIEVPLSFSFSPLSWQTSLKTYGYLRGGFSPAFLVRSKYKCAYNFKDEFSVYVPVGQSEKGDFKNTNFIDICPFVAFGLRKWEHFGVEGKYELGILGVVNKKGEMRQVYNSTFSLNMEFYF